MEVINNKEEVTPTKATEWRAQASQSRPLKP